MLSNVVRRQPRSRPFRPGDSGFAQVLTFEQPAHPLFPHPQSTYADGSEEDYKNVNALQAQHKIVPLSEPAPVSLPFLFRIVGDSVRILVVRHDSRHPSFGIRRPISRLKPCGARADFT